MRVASLKAAGVAALAAFVAITFAVTGCSTQTPAVTKHVAQHVAKRAVVNPTTIKVVTDLTYGVADGVPLRLDICMPVAKKGIALSFRPAIVSIHGGSWLEGDKAEPQWRAVCTWLASAGYVVADVDYRLAPRYVYPDESDDVESAVEWLRSPAEAKRFGIDPTLIGAFGGSAGGNLAALVGTSGSGPLDVGHRVAAVAELSGPADLTAKAAEHPILRPRVLSYLGCRSYANCPQAIPASPIDIVDPSDPPFFIAHSVDELIPLSQSVNFAARLRSAGIAVTLVEEPGALHSISMLTDPLRAQIIQFYKANLVHHKPAPVTP
jgi:acetyl esterase